MKAIDDRIAAAEKAAQEAARKLKQLKAQKAQVEARKLHALLKGDRADDTRRKILAGALVLDMMERDEDTRSRFLARLDSYLTRDDDRALFALAPKAAPPAGA